MACGSRLVLTTGGVEVIIPSEHEEQKKVIEWWRLESASRKIPEDVLFAIPNGGKRNVATGRVLKSEGVRSGIPDLFLALKRHSFSGFFIEMKRVKRSVLSEKQTEIHAILRRCGYRVEVCYGADDAIEKIEEYLNE